MIGVRRGLMLSLLGLVALATGSARAETPTSGGELIEVVVGLSQAPLASTRTLASGRGLHARTIASAQHALETEIAGSLPAAQIRWRYRLVANGMAVVLPARSSAG